MKLTLEQNCPPYQLTYTVRNYGESNSSYCRTALPTMGEIATEVSHGQQNVEGRFIIVGNTNGQLPLLGRNWLYQLSLDWPMMLKRGNGSDPRVHTLHTATLVNEFPEVTRKGLGLLKGMKAEVGLKEGAAPKFCKSRPIPFDLLEWVKHVRQKQVKDGEIEPVEQNDWAAPIVAVKKNDGGLRVCADFHGDNQPILQDEDVPLPMPDEVFATLTHGESFSKLDLARAYKQMEVEEGSRAFLTINQHTVGPLPVLPPAIWNSLSTSHRAKGNVSGVARI